VLLYFKHRFMLSGMVLFLSLGAMVGIRHILRLVELQGVWEPTTIPVAPQWSVFGIFLICFLIAIASVWAMLKLLFSSTQRATPQ